MGVAIKVVEEGIGGACSIRCASRRMAAMLNDCGTMGPWSAINSLVHCRQRHVHHLVRQREWAKKYNGSGRSYTEGMRKCARI